MGGGCLGELPCGCLALETEADQAFLYSLPGSFSLDFLFILAKALLSLWENTHLAHMDRGICVSFQCDITLAQPIGDVGLLGKLAAAGLLWGGGCD